MNNILALAPYMQQASTIFQNAQASVPQLQAIFSALQSGGGSSNVADTVSNGLTSLFNAASAGPTLPNGAPNPVNKTLLTDLYRASSILNETCKAFTGTLDVGLSALSVTIPPQLCQFATNARSTLQSNLKSQGVDLSAIDADVEKVKSFMTNQKPANASAASAPGAAALLTPNTLPTNTGVNTNTSAAESWPWWKYVVFIVLPLLIVVAIVAAVAAAASKKKKATTTYTQSSVTTTLPQQGSGSSERANLLDITSQTSSQ